MNNEVDANAEFKAMKSVHEALASLNDESRARVLNYIASLFGVATKPVIQRAPSGSNPLGESGVDEGDEESDGGKQPEGKQFSTFAELHDAVSPKTNAEHALVAGYWLQVCKGAPSFTANPANRELANLGHRLPHHR